MADLEVFVANEQNDFKLDLSRWMVLARDCLKSENVIGPAELFVIFCDEAASSWLNERFMSKVGPTDVLSFPIASDPIESGRSPDSGGTGPQASLPITPKVPYLLGDVVICPSVAAANAKEHSGDRRHDGSLEDEIALLLVHGILHLRGMDHLEDDEADKMEAREDALLEQFYRHKGHQERRGKDD